MATDRCPNIQAFCFLETQGLNSNFSTPVVKLRLGLFQWETSGKYLGIHQK